MQIYVHRDGQQLGPYSAEEVRQYLADGNLSADDLAWHEGATDWVPLAQIEGVVSGPEPARTKTPSWVPQRRGEADVETPMRFAEPLARAVTPEPSPMPSPVAEDPPSEDAVQKKRQLSPIEKRRRKQKETGKQLMGFGALVFLCGAGATLLTFFAAAGQGGGVFIVFIGLIATGVVLFVAGYKQYTGT
jgi:hypothetical protein